MKSWLDAANAAGGGDTPEAVADALHEVLKLSWRDESTKICVFIADAPPHGLGTRGDGFPEGCPDGVDPMHVAAELAQKGITMYMVGCQPSITPYKDFFMAIAHMTGGQYVPLSNATLLAKVIIGGAQEEISLQRLMEEVNQEVIHFHRLCGGGYVDEESMTKAVSEKLKKKGARAKQLKMNSSELRGPSKSAVKLSSKRNMAEVKEEYMKSMATSHMVPKPSPSRYLTRSRKKIATSSSHMPKSAPKMSSPRPTSARRIKGRTRASRRLSAAATTSARRKVRDDSLVAMAPSDDVYEVEEDQEITRLQTLRMVKKSIARNKMQVKST
ncbi:uncharacterized protein [Ptychodera flava]